MTHITVGVAGCVLAGVVVGPLPAGGPANAAEADRVAAASARKVILSFMVGSPPQGLIRSLALLRTPVTGTLSTHVRNVRIPASGSGSNRAGAPNSPVS